MARIIIPILLSVAVLGAAPALAEMPAAVDPEAIPNYQVIRPGLAFGGQPSAETLERLGELGFRTIVSLRTEREGAVEEGEVVRAQGLDFLWVPVTADTFSTEDVAAVESVLDDPVAAPVLLHCASGNRVAAVWGAILARDGRAREEVEADSRAAGLHSPSMWKALLRVLEWAPEPAAVNP
jgi:uncharacterized protein (TIGR01244 family)